MLKLTIEAGSIAEMQGYLERLSDRPVVAGDPVAILKAEKIKEAAVAAEKPASKKKAAAKKPAAKKAEPKAEPATPTPEVLAADPEEGVTIPYSKVQAATIGLATTKGADVAVKVLQTFGVTKAPQLEADQYQGYLDAVEAEQKAA